MKEYRIIELESGKFTIGLVTFNKKGMITNVTLGDNKPRKTKEKLLSSLDAQEILDCENAFRKEAIKYDSVSLAIQVVATEVMKQDVQMGKFTQSEFMKDGEELNSIARCPNCGGKHFRHAGYMYKMIPFNDSEKGTRVTEEELRVLLCLAEKCDAAIVFTQGKIFDVTNMIDRKAWEKKEKELIRQEGPGSPEGC